jgi:hypothetical protein
LGSGGESKKFDWDLFSENCILVISFNHVSNTMKEAVIEFLALSSLFGDFVQKLAHGNDWDSQVDRKPSW